MRKAAVLGALAALLTATAAAAEETPASPGQPALDLSSDRAPGPAVARESASSTDAPPPPPYKKTVVLDASVGALGFLGEFGKLAPPGPWMHVQLGWELLRWLMVFGEGELGFTDTSRSEPAPRTRAFPMFGFGGGARLTWRVVERLGLYGQASVGMLKADIATNALGLHGFRDAESLGVSLGLRAGIEWYQVDRHLAFGLNIGFRNAQGFARTGASSDSPLALDGGVSLRYAF